jgi:ABC-type Fe3+-hydroxamate transport system substrate-binding protein
VPPDDPRRQPARTAVVTGLVGDAGGRRVFIDATGAGVALPPAVRRVVGTDPVVGELLRRVGAPLVACAGEADGLPPVGGPGRPDPVAVAGQRPDVIVAGAVDRVLALDGPVAAALRRVAPVVAVDLDRPAAAAADLRALIGSVAGPPPPPPPTEPPPVMRPRLG